MENCSVKRTSYDPSYKYIMDNNQSNILITGLVSFYKHQQYTDITLIIENKEIHCHRNVLAAMSPFFNTMFSCEMTEKYQNRIPLPYIENFEIMSEIVEYMYTGEIELDLKNNNIQQLYLAANFFQLKCLVDHCIGFIIRNTNTSNCLSILQFAMKYDCSSVLQNAKKVICENFVDISKQDEFLCLDCHLIKEIMQWDELKIDSELYLFECCHKWIQKGDAEPREQYSEYLLGCIRFPSMELTCLRTALMDSLVLKTLHPDDILKLKRILKYPLRKNETDLDYTQRTCFKKEEVIAVLVSAPSFDFQIGMKSHEYGSNLTEVNTLYLVNVNSSMISLSYSLPAITALAGCFLLIYNFNFY